MVIATIPQLPLKFPPCNRFTPLYPPKPRSPFICRVSLEPPTLLSSQDKERESKQLRVVFAAGGAVQWGKSMRESRKIMKEFKSQIVVGTGGYESFPICFIAFLKGLKMVIQSQSSVPGLANWFLSLVADIVFVAYNSSVDCFPTEKKKIVVTGNPVRLSIKKFVSKAVARSYFFPRLAKVDSEVLVLLVLGGSFGANSMNISLFNIYYQMLEARPNLHIIWETGVESFDEMESLVRNHPRLVLAP